MTAILASYPCSGSHLVRFLIEALTGNPTQGCLVNSADIPIYKNQFPQNPNILEHVHPKKQTIAIKHHSFAEIRDNIKERNLKPSSLLLLIRDPIDVISAHIADRGKNQSISQFKQEVQNEVEEYLDLVVFYETCPLKKEILVYEKISSLNVKLASSEIQKLVDFFEENIVIDKLIEVLSFYDDYLSVSASGKGRGWRGYRSQGKKYYHLSKLDREKIGIILDVVKENVKQKQLDTFFKKYYEYIFQLDIDGYLKRVSNCHRNGELNQHENPDTTQKIEPAIATSQESKKIGQIKNHKNIKKQKQPTQSTQCQKHIEHSRNRLQNLRQELLSYTILELDGSLQSSIENS